MVFCCGSRSWGKRLKQGGGENGFLWNSLESSLEFILFVICACKPDRKLDSQLLSLLWLAVLRTLLRKMGCGKMSKVLMMPMVSRTVHFGGLRLLQPYKIVYDVYVEPERMEHMGSFFHE